MELGERLRQARLEAGLSQRQLCGEEITRNMLSQIENGSAKPSMKTLQFLASRLGKNVSYFLEETVTASPNQSCMTAAREAFDAGAYARVVELLTEYQAPDVLFDREKQLLWVLSHLELAERAIGEKRVLYGAELLAKASEQTAYCSESIARRRLLLAGRMGTRVSGALPSLDEELRLRAGEALAAGKPERAAKLLDAVEDQQQPEWNLLRGEAYLEAGAYREATQCLHRAEGAYPRETIPMLERCYRELEDFRRAYEYACKLR